MDAHTLDLLQFDKVRSLLATYASSPLGKEKAATLTPSVDAAALRKQIARTTEMVQALETRLVPPLAGLRDVRTAVKRAEMGVLLEIDQIRDIRDVYELTGRVFDYWMKLGRDYPELDRLLSETDDMRHYARAIDAAIDEKGVVRSSASEELGKIRAELADYEAKIQAELRRLLRQPDVQKALRYQNATVNGEHHVLPIAVNYRHQIAGVVHRTSSSGETVYIEPAKVAELNAEVSILKSAELREIRKVLRRFTATVAKHADRLLRIVEMLGELDFTHAKALCSREYFMSAPEIVDDGRLSLSDARHPLLLHLLREKKRKAALVKKRAE
ncbi:MAG: endonuclease MutS2, partial [Planctomycetia bacterium]